MKNFNINPHEDYLIIHNRVESPADYTIMAHKISGLDNKAKIIKDKEFGRGESNISIHENGKLIINFSTDHYLDNFSLRYTTTLGYWSFSIKGYFNETL